MSTTPNQKDLLAKKIDLEGILKPDANDILHLPDITITLAESGQFYLAGISKKLLTLIGNTSGNAVTLDGDAGLTFTTSGGSSTITGITSSSGNSASLAASQSMVSAKQDQIIAGTNIQIAQDGKTISATDTNTLSDLTDTAISSLADGQVLKYNATSGKWVNGTGGGGAEVILGTTAPTAAQGSNGNLYIQYDDTNNNTVTHEYVKISGAWEEIAIGGGGSSVIANPSGIATDSLSSIEIDGTIYSIEGGGSGGGSYLSTIINDGTAVSNVLSLSNPYTDFDELLFTWEYDNDHYINTLKLDTSDINDTITINDYYNRDIVLTVTSATEFTITSQASGMIILSIRGLKNSTATKEKQRDVLWTTGIWTMAHPITDYDEIVFKWGSSNSTSFIPSDIMIYQNFIVLNPTTNYFMWFYVTDDSNFTLHQDGGLTITSVEGVIYTREEPIVFAEELTLADYSALTTEEKNDGTIRFIPAGSGSEGLTAIDMTDITVYQESSMNATAVSSNEIDVTWDSGVQIGCNFDFNTPIDVTDYDRITFKVTNGSCYNNGTQAMYTRWDMMIGLMSAPLGSLTNIEPTDSRWVVVADMPLSNHVYEETLDVSGLTGSYYLVVSAHGWNTTIEDITLRQGGDYPSQIRYMSKTYAENSGAPAMKLTQAEYDALTREEKENGTIYFIDDIVDDSTQLIERVSTADTRITSSGHSRWGGEDWGAFDRVSAAVSDITNAWCALEDDATPWIQYHFDQPYYLTKLVMVVYQHYNASSSAKTVNMNILGSHDGNTWTNIAADGQTKSVTFKYQVKDTIEIELNLGQYEYIRIQGTEVFNIAYNFGCDFDEIYVYGRANPSTPVQKIYYMGKCYTNTGGSGSGNPELEETALLTTPITAEGTYTLLDNIEDYDFVSFVSGISYEADIRLLAVSDMLNMLDNNLIINCAGTAGRWFNITALSGTSITITKYSETIIQSIMGYKYKGGSGSESNIVIVSRTDNTNPYAWLIPCDANGNTLKPSEVTLLSIFAEADMSGAPPYYNGLNICVDTDSDRYCCKLYDTQSGNYASDGIYSVDYTVAYIPNSGGSSGGGSSTLSGLSDVSVSSPINGQLLKYNSSTQKWENVNDPSSPQTASGTFTTGANQYDKVEINCGFRPDYIQVLLPFSQSDTVATYDSDVSTTASTWYIPQESRTYTLTLGVSQGETGISDITNTGFKFRCNAGNTRNVACTYIASKAASGGSSSHSYSTTEQKVGTWIDGSDIYEKSFEVTITQNMPIIEQDASYIDALISYDAVVKNSLGYISGVGMDASGWSFALHRNPSAQLLLYGNLSEAIGGKAYVTIRYTKVTQGQN